MDRDTAELSNRGTVTLPASVRRRLGLVGGDVFTVRVADGSIVLTPAVLANIELYTDERMEEFAKNSELSEEEIAKARASWGLPSTRRRDA